MAFDIRHGAVRKDGHIWDLTRPLTEDCKVEFFSFDDPEGKEVRGTHCMHISRLPPATVCLA